MSWCHTRRRCKIDKELIYNVHLSDGKRPGIGQEWVDEKLLRGYLLGEGEIPLQECSDAIKNTG